MGTRRVVIQTPSIELAALLKWARVAGSGGEAKQLILGGRVRVNGEVEQRRGRKIVAGDHIDVDGESILVTWRENQTS